MKYILSISTILMLLLKINAKKVSCYPGIKEKGYDCCKAPCSIERIDKYGYWGKQDGKECGCGMNGYDKNNIESCDKYFTDKGFECCDNCYITRVDNNGYYWGVQMHDRDGETCGISGFCINYVDIVDYT